MKSRCTVAVFALLVAGDMVRAQPAAGPSGGTPTLPAATLLPPAAAAAPVPPAPDATGCHLGVGDDHPAGCTAPRVYGEVDYLIWWMRGAFVPPLITTSPPGTAQAQAGVIGAPNTIILFGETNDANRDVRSGTRLTVGYWLDCQDTCGVEVSLFTLETKAFALGTTSPTGSMILARPFVDATTNQATSQLVAFPGQLGGSILASETSSGLSGVGALCREKLWGAGDGCYRVDVIAGYRYLRFADHLGVFENLTSLSATNPFNVAVGTTLTVTDRFDTKNEFNGFDLGLTGDFHFNCWTLTWRARLAVGVNDEYVNIAGATTVSVPGAAAPVPSNGGLLALQSNIGQFHKDEVNVIPEFGLRVGYQLNDHLRVTGGYTFLYWDNLVRPGNQVDLTVNPNLIPPVVANAPGPNAPASRLTEKSSLWVQGIDLGLEYRY